MKSRSLTCLYLILLGTAMLAQSNPVPLINNPLVPSSATPGGQGFTLTINGTGFVSGSVVDWNGSALTTTFVSSSRLTAAVPASDISVAGTASVTVTNPGSGDLVSNVDFFEIRVPFAMMGLGHSSVQTGPDGPYSPVAADLNGDGRLDIVNLDGTHGSGISTLSVLIGNGDGTFQSPANYALPSYYRGSSPVVADFNGDGKLDLAVADQDSADLLIFLGNGDGTFQAAQSYTTVLAISTAMGKSI